MQQNVVDNGKYSPTKFAQKRRPITFETDMVGFPIYKLCMVIFFILQHFATKLCHFINFKMLFLAAMKDFVCTFI